jgi:hypothetical protein
MNVYHWFKGKTSMGILWGIREDEKKTICEKVISIEPKQILSLPNVFIEVKDAFYFVEP